MKIIMVHNFYSSAIPSGENQVFLAEKKVLEENGFFVGTFLRHNNDIKKKPVLGALKSAVLAPWNFSAVRQLRKICQDNRVDLIHVHNTFPMLSPSVFYAVPKNVATVLTLHNYRIFCPAAIPMRAGKVCTLCIDQRTYLPSIFHGCYKKSRAATLPLAFSNALHDYIKTWHDKVDAFICLSDFQRELVIKAGLPAERVHVKPNFYPGNPTVVPWSERKPYVVFVGRLSSEKGVMTLIRAWKKWGSLAPELRIIGSGELRCELETMSAGLSVKFLGQLTVEQTQNEIGNSMLQILPSEWFETFGLVVIEAFAHGTPAAVSRIGALPSLVQHKNNGLIFEPADVDSLLNTVRSAWSDPALLQDLASNARQSFESHYTKEANLKMLVNIYDKAIQVAKSK